MVRKIWDSILVLPIAVGLVGHCARVPEVSEIPERKTGFEVGDRMPNFGGEFIGFSVSHSPGQLQPIRVYLYDTNGNDRPDVIYYFATCEGNTKVAPFAVFQAIENLLYIDSNGDEKIDRIENYPADNTSIDDYIPMECR